jgi:excisionase family DNA binding protein
MNVEQVAEYLGLDVESIYRMVSTGQIPFVEVAGELWFEKDVIDVWVRFLDCGSMH